MKKAATVLALLLVLATCTKRSTMLQMPVPPLPLDGAMLDCVAQQCTGWDDSKKIACQTDGHKSDQRWYIHVAVLYPNGIIWAPKAALNILEGDQRKQAIADCNTWYRMIDKLRAQEPKESSPEDSHEKAHL